MQRILIVVIVLYVIWRVLHSWGRRMARGARGAEDYSKFSARRRGRETPSDNEELVGCATCGTLIPAGRALGDGRGAYCSESCRAAARERNGTGR